MIICIDEETAVEAENEAVNEIIEIVNREKKKLVQKREKEQVEKLESDENIKDYEQSTPRSQQIDEEKRKAEEYQKDDNQVNENEEQNIRNQVRRVLWGCVGNCQRKHKERTSKESKEGKLTSFKPCSCGTPNAVNGVALGNEGVPLDWFFSHTRHPCVNVYWITQSWLDAHDIQQENDRQVFEDSSSESTNDSSQSDSSSSSGKSSEDNDSDLRDKHRRRKRQNRYRHKMKQRKKG
ncbi:MAG: hypothetical protein EZS28_023582 [Streblomastix strix]|uniref:Uncharacterized protein n=1 Tax=Streblomastix strix TaxID=222440 RepID=A0A5J4VEC7_9EUKA|nr:MAG: hypothetical protein EZS28_023582 [Streblomastix strix]